MRINTKCSVAVHCLLFLHEYSETQRVTSGILALSTGCNPVVIRNLISALKKAGIVEVAGGKAVRDCAGHRRRSRFIRSTKLSIRGVWTIWWASIRCPRRCVPSDEISVLSWLFLTENFRRM